MRRFLALAAAAGLLTGGLAAAAPAVARTAAPAAAQALKWGKCAESDLRQAGAACAMLTVPLNYSNPTGATIKIAVSRIKHTSSAAKYQGVILTNPGGPGGSGLDLNTFLIAQLKAEGSTADKAAVGDYDWIGFDPRGVGSSVPAITCAPFYFSGDRENYDPSDQADPELLAAPQRPVRRSGCATHSAAQSALLDNMTTVDIGPGHGQHPAGARARARSATTGSPTAPTWARSTRRCSRRTSGGMIMDSNVDPRKVWYQANLDQDIAFNRNIKIWFGWLAKYHSFYHLGPDREGGRKPRSTRKRPGCSSTPSRRSRRPGRDGPTSSWSAGYYEETWLQLGSAFADWAHTHGAKAGADDRRASTRAWTGPATTTSSPSTTRSSARTRSGRRSWAVWSRDDHRVNKIAPFETWGNAWFNAPVPAPGRRPPRDDPDARINGKRDQQCAADRRDAGRGDAVRGQPRGPRSCSRTRCCWPSRAAPRTPTRCSVTCAWTTPSPTTWRTGKLPARNPNAKWDKTCKPLPRPNPSASSSSSPGAARALAPALRS